MLPEGIGVIPLCLNVQRGSLVEFQKGVHAYEPKIAELVEAGVDVINPSGAPPFMVLGYRGEQELIKTWEKKYKTTIFTSGTTTLDALRALEIKRFVGATYFRGDINKIYAKYFADAGFEILDMAGMDVDFDKVQELSSLQVYRFVKRVFLAHPRRRRSTCWAPAGARSTSSRSWSRTSACRSFTRSRRNAGISSGTSTCANRSTGFGRLIAEMPGTGISYQ